MSGDLTARDVIARAIAKRLDGYEVTPWSLTDDALAALAAAGWELKRKPDARWGFILNGHPDHVYERYGKDSAERGISVNPEGRALVWWPHGGTGWEVAPDA